MKETLTADSYIVRIYRVNAEDGSKVTGLVELLDGSGERRPFTDLSELAAVFSCGAGNRCVDGVTRAAKAK